MCFGGGGGPSKAEQEAANRRAAEQRAEAEIAKREEIERKAVQKREDISQALSSRTERRGMRGGAGRRSLFQASGAGFMGRFSR